MTQAEEMQEKFQELRELLKAQRDELGLKMHLAKMEVQDEWKTVEEKWQHFQSRVDQLEKEIGNSSHEVGNVLGDLGEELKESYRRIRKLL